MDVSAPSLDSSFPNDADGDESWVRDFPDKKLVKVYASGARKATCKHCGEGVEWFKTVNRERFMLFNGGVVALKTGDHQATGEPVLYLDREECHWEKCASQQ